MQLDVTIITHSRVMFKGKADSVVLPGDYGVFEVLPFHKRAMSRLLKGRILVDEKSFPILRGVAKIEKNEVTIAVEPDTE